MGSLYPSHTSKNAGKFDKLTNQQIVQNARQYAEKG